MVKIPPASQASKLSPADWVLAVTLATLKKTPAPITVPITVEKAANKPMFFCSCFGFELFIKTP
jgi:hypothetical protein